MNLQTNICLAVSSSMLNFNNSWHRLLRSLLLTGVITVITLVVSGCEGGGSSSENATIGVTGTGGSTARMTIDKDKNYLYAISSNSEVQVFDITRADQPIPFARVPIGWDIETLFPYGDYLLIGASSGMFIMDNRDPANPQYLSEFFHATARDPVIAHWGYAYITLRTENGFGFANQMDVVDINDITNPTLARSIAMQGPSGLSVGTTDNGEFRDELYVCDDVAGVKIFDLSDKSNPTIVDTIRDVNCNDVIATGGILYVITNNSLIKYDYTQYPPARLSVVTEAGS